MFADSLDDGAGHRIFVPRVDGGSGAVIWRAPVQGDGSAGDWISRAARLDAAGGVYIGAGLTSAKQRDFAVVKLDAATGAELWRRTFDGAVHGDDAATDLVVHGNGDVTAIGFTDRGGTQENDFLTVIKVDGQGNPVWRQDLVGYTYASVGSSAVAAADSAGNVVVGCSMYDSDTTKAYVLVAKFASEDGSVVWRYTRPAQNTEVNGVAVDDAGDVAVGAGVAGETFGFAVAKISGADGSELWRRQFFGTGIPLEGTARAVTFDGGGDVVAVGHSTLDFQHGNLFAVKFDGGTGAEEWRQSLHGTNGDQSVAYAVAVDADNDVIVGGSIDNVADGGPNANSAVAKLASSDGAVLWRQELDGGAVFRTALDGSGDLYALNLLYPPMVPPLGVQLIKIDGETGGPVRLPGAALRLIDPVNPARRRLVLRSRSPMVAALPHPSANPMNTGAVLKITNPMTSESTSIPLPASGWAPMGSSVRPRGISYRGGSGQTCSLVRIKRGRSLEVVCRGPGIGFTLDETSQGRLQVELIIGAQRQCMEFGGVTKDKRGRFFARKASAPAECP